MAVQAFNKHVSANYPAENPAAILKECVQKANKAIKDTVSETPALEGMGCTMVAAILEKGKLWWASVGDSHLFLIRNRELIKKNADHSYGGFLDRMAAAGTPVEPEPGLARNMLMSAITGDEINEIDVPQTPFDLQAGDRILLCSDGLDTLSAGKIIQFSEWSESPKECAEALLKAVEEAAMPKQDNTTVVVVSVVERAAAVVAAPPPAAAVPTPAPAPQPAYAEPAPTMESMTEAAPEKSKTGLYVGIAAAVVVAVAAGAFFAMGGKKTPAPAAPVAAIEPAATEEPVAAEEAGEEAAVSAEEAETEVSAEDAGEPAEPEEIAAPVPAPAPAPVADREFRDTLKDGKPGPEMVWLPVGSFEMGSPGSSRFAEERPRHTVKMKRIAVSKYEITFAEYEKFANATGRKVPDNLYLDKATHPVFFVTWDDGFYYAQWLSEQTGKTYRLPSESQWEYAAGAGQTSPFWWGFEEEPGRAHCFGCGTGFDPRKPTKVGSFPPNGFGVHDTAGNVAEWVRDCWHDNYTGAPTDGSAWEGGDCAYRIARGGAFSSPAQSIRHAKRDRFKSDQVYDHIGFRVVREE
jgi:formylglycine-generating enzyme required for sulfatase activity/serine/threonine protein phosphatase PrpC